MPAIAEQDSKPGVLPWSVVILIGIVGGPLCWFAMIHPLWPKTTVGWVVGTIAGVVVGLWAVGNTVLIGWLHRRERYQLLCKAIGAIVALSLGVGIFWFAMKGQSFIVENFSYFGR